jgi:hypothetical protein
MLYVNGITYRLTKHGRERFIERVAMMRDPDIVKSAQKGKIFNFFKGFDYKNLPDSLQWDSMRLITVYFENAENCLDAFECLNDSPSGFTFHFSQLQRRFNNEAGTSCQDKHLDDAGQTMEDCEAGL